MIKLEREHKTKEVVKNNNILSSSQASFNSDGLITIRNYDNHNKDNDEIIILNARETNAIIELFRKLKNNNMTLPF